MGHRLKAAHVDHARMRDDAAAVVQHIREHTGDALQVVLLYDADDHRDLYRREDVAALHDSPLEHAVIDTFRTEPGTEQAAEGFGVQGDLQASVRLFEKRAVLHLPRDETSGTIVVLDSTAAANLAEFVADLRADLYGA